MRQIIVAAIGGKRSGDWLVEECERMGRRAVAGASVEIVGRVIGEGQGEGDSNGINSVRVTAV